MRILIVDDEPELLEQIRQALNRQQYTTDTAMDGEEALDRAFSDPYDLIILDVMLPKKDGFGVLLELRNEKITTPILMLTARGEIEDRIKGLDLGADDYLAKPFSMAELLARIRALLRRGNELVTSVLETGNLRLNTATREVTLNDRPLKLTPKEFSVLEFLLYNRNRAVSRFSMAEHVWGDAFDPFTMSNNIDVHIKNLRRKIGDTGGEVIRTVRGVGYIIRDDD
ncbi:DNA-binding response regulator [Desulfolithobacter dissulfuricans]|uniref:DNA-binding response regulator n=1 Tax=Desulfolithobacter dissulfuricans TaxID=2795293 RepID=A0A915UAF2_9BACT|nr:response regulator transcription factor [Desulfolithobacter dissulfuricans]BCO09485.1 DNA-binding response regulator [Desulfolithobacter dissulfuricans]